MAKSREIGILGHSMWDTCRYFGYIWKHKWYTFIECCHWHIPFLGLIHDQSKFSCAEFGPYVNWFYDDQGHKFNGGYASEFIIHEKFKRAFDYAWNNHIHHNPHHWQYWLLDGKPLLIPECYIREMVADWVGCSKAKTGKNDVSVWYSKQETLVLHPQTRKRVEELLVFYGFIPIPALLYKDAREKIWSVSNNCQYPGWWVVENGFITSEQEGPANTKEEAEGLLKAHAEKNGFTKI